MSNYTPDNWVVIKMDGDELHITESLLDGVVDILMAIHGK
jgi:hypothetical protein